MSSVADFVLSGSRWAFFLGDALALLRELPDQCVDAVITDPPYSSGGAFRGDRMDSPNKKYISTGTLVERMDFAGDNRDQRSFAYWCVLWLSEALRVAKPGAPIVLFTDWRQLPTCTDMLQAGGWVWRGILPWNKGEGSRPTQGRFANQCEYMVWGSAGAMPFERENGIGPSGCLKGIFTFPVLQADKHHVTGKPSLLMREVVKITEPRGLILDPFGGSFTTGVAALLEGYRALGFERVEGIHATGRERAEDAERVARGEKSRLIAFEAGDPIEAAGKPQLDLFGGAK
jgi:site-specific DNA-methyltransferase (adenine-specific)